VKSDRSSPASAPSPTPTDLQAYATQARSTTSDPPSMPVPTRLSISRRPALDLPFTAAKPPAVAAAPSQLPADLAAQGLSAIPDPGGVEPASEFDVPAFLRRSEG
jgi:hypothetical protein